MVLRGERCRSDKSARVSAVLVWIGGMREGKGSDKTTLAVFFVPSDRLDIRSLGTAVKTFVAELI